jgi:hypothetical protein
MHSQTIRIAYSAAAFVAALSAVAMTCRAGIEIETFDGGVFNNPVFQHEIEFDQPCCWSIENCETAPPVTPTEGVTIGVCVLHLRPNTDLITFDLKPGEQVQTFSIEIQDFEGGFVGSVPSSAVVVRGVTGDFISLHAAAMGVAEVVTASASTLGQISGKPIGAITSVSLQVANEGNSVFPDFFGAYFDDITIDVVPATPGDTNADGVVDVDDLVAVILAWGPCPPPLPSCAADMNQSGTVDVDDLVIVILNWE